jgi:hypothetical protein
LDIATEATIPYLLGRKEDDVMHEYFSELVAQERLDRLRRFAARQALVRALEPPRRSWRAALGLALIRSGRWMLRGLPERPTVASRRTA